MPTYEYHCSACKQDMEIFQSMKDAPLDRCPSCGKRGKIQRRISGGAGIIFKGTGFYETDYKKQSGQGGSGESSGSSSSGDSPSTTKADKPKDKAPAKGSTAKVPAGA